MKKYALYLVCFFLAIGKAHSQYRIVKVQSENVFLRLYDKINASKEIRDDSTTYLWKVIDRNHLWISKYVRNRRVWRFRYKIIPSKDTLQLNVKVIDSAGSKNERKRVQYYWAIKEAA